ncbi:MAG: ATP-grasp domain-containing protein [Planctomycetaceae bacterium]|nr:ATP-grasp domain-containing protein [Planctomycetaceae bacterium]
MRIALLEAVSAGLCGDSPGISLLHEGLAMWRALIEDLASVPGVQIDSLLGVPWQEHRLDVERLHIWPTNGPAEAVMCWASALEDADHALVIAPESEGCLLQLATALPSTIHSWNCSLAAIGLCSDKLRLAEHLQRCGVATIPTEIEAWIRPPAPDDYPCVIKPRDGAGSFLVRRVTADVDWREVRDEYAAHGNPPAIRQPCIVGGALSIAGWCRGDRVQWFPVAEQHLSTDGRFEYRGGRIPADMPDPVVDAVRALAQKTVASIPGLRGYIGCDILRPEKSPLTPLLVEVNPRFTTSYVGYRHWWARSPWQDWLSEADATLLPRGEIGRVHFRADGTVFCDDR